MLFRSPSDGSRRNNRQAVGNSAIAGTIVSHELISPLPVRGGVGQGEGGQLTSGHSRANPFPASLLTNRRLNAPGSAKDVRHFEISLHGSSLGYEAGDALASFRRMTPSW